MGADCGCGVSCGPQVARSIGEHREIICDTTGKKCCKSQDGEEKKELKKEERERK